VAAAAYQVPRALYPTANGSRYAPREALAGKDARQLARELLGMTQEAFSGAFSKSPMKQAELQGLTRNAAVVLRNVGTAEDVQPAGREHAAWALARLRAYDASTR
jgi:epoxyqueuosine reductase QueG